MTRNANGSHISGVTSAQAVYLAYQRGQRVYVNNTQVEVEVLACVNQDFVRIRTDHGAPRGWIRDVHATSLRVASPLEELAKIMDD